MRYLCHINGCDLVFCSVKEKVPTQLFKAMLTRHVFDVSLNIKIERDHNQALNVYAGSDNLLHIGEPEGAGMRGRVSFEQIWSENLGQVFKKTVEEEKNKYFFGDASKYAEERID